MQTISIAPAKLNDCGECAVLLVAQLAEHGVEISAENLTRVLERAVSDARHGFLVLAREGARMIGVSYSATLLSAEHCGFVASLEELYVTPDCRGRGIGTELLMAVIERAKADGMAAIELEVDADHGRVMSLYERFGFRRLDRSRWLRTFPSPTDNGSLEKRNAVKAPADEPEKREHGPNWEAPG